MNSELKPAIVINLDRKLANVIKRQRYFLDKKDWYVVNKYIEEKLNDSFER